VFDLHIPPSLESLPGRFVNLCWDEDDLPVKALPKPKQTREEKRAYDRMRHARDRETRNANAMERYHNRTPEQDAALKARRAKSWLKNKERINARRRKVK
jgi:hypothetical protein